ncbi:tetratricopeptide repeat protein [Parvibaculum sp.]|jgi:Flp pilus assembly protein TadD|uniref:tetratricopeptide repeat protein n=1 Tax=Parvibaculum sp. TaxID=2024848 RepID=UPI001B08B2D1|nr:tetratricopeptide repeat protein [Parvibaculum sp.]MBO6635651.1 tetratricopeptide repeat protein [Parvibaculum sp.]MBO6677676.1 tetratricopeptide repeat protein [Parvibaculum sp.]MBO6685962.1 tetratricopeptide repeat protein [Parvibaculum sp.]MBO6904192.1 tetratricopeptide repeat protein [Parvibaculum sp.]
MKTIITISLCLAIAGCADSGFDFDPVSTVIPRSSEVKSLDDASTSKLYLSVVNGLLEQGRYHAALAYLDQYAVQEKKTPYFTELYGEALLGTEQYNKAAEAFAELEDTERESEGFSGLGRVSASSGDWAGAVVYFKRAVASRPSSAEYLNNLGYAQLCAGGAVREAEFNLRQAQELDPSSASIRNNLVIALLLSGKDNEARRLLSGIPTARERAEVQKFAADWLKQRPEAGTAKEEM